LKKVFVILLFLPLLALSQNKQTIQNLFSDFINSYNNSYVTFNSSIKYGALTGTVKATGGVLYIDTTGSVGEANTASNLGGGLANFDSKSGVDLRFNSFLASDFNLASNLISLDYVNGQKASASVAGFLSSADWTTFNNKQATIGITGENYLSYSSPTITANAVNLSGSNVTGTLAAARFPALTGDVTTSAGALATTLATVNSNIGTFQGITVNGKGLVTAASNQNYVPNTTTVTINGTSNRLTSSAGSQDLSANRTWTLDISGSYVGQSSITTLGTVSTGVWGSSATKIGLASGGTNADLSATGGAGQYLKQSSSGAAITVGTIPASDLPGTFSGFGNPSNPSVDLTGANGSATTAMRSDAKLILDQTIVPTMTGIWTHSGRVDLKNSAHGFANRTLADTSGGEDTTMFSVQYKPLKWAMYQGTFASPLTLAGSSVKFVRKQNIDSTAASNKADVAANSALYVYNEGTINNYGQPVAITGLAQTYSNRSYTTGNDAAGIAGYGRAMSGATGVGLGGFFDGRRDDNGGKANAIQFSVSDWSTRGGATYSSTGFDSTSSVWLSNHGTAGNITSAFIKIGNADGIPALVGIGFASQNGSPVTQSDIRTDDTSRTAILIQGIHNSAAIGVASGSGNVGIGTTTPTGRFHIVGTNGTDAGLLFNVSGSTSNATILQTNPTSTSSNTSQLNGWNYAPSFNPSGASLSTITGGTFTPAIIGGALTIASYHGASFRADITSGSSDTVTTEHIIRLNNPTVSGNNRVTNLDAIGVPDMTMGTSRNSGIYLGVSSGTGKYNVYAWNTAQNYFGGNVGILNSAPSAALTIGASGQFQINSTGNPVLINNVTTSWPSSQGAAKSYLRNDGSGNFSWTNAFQYSVNGDGASLTVDSVRFANSGRHKWSRTANAVSIEHQTPSTEFELYEDFVANGSVGNQGFSNYASGTLAATTSYSGTTGYDSSRVGIIQLATGTTASGSTGEYLGNTNIFAGGGVITVELAVFIPTLSTSSQRFIVIAGLGNNNAVQGANTAGIYFSYSDSASSGAWVANVAQGGTTTALTTGATVAANTWYRLAFTTAANGGSATFTVNGANTTTPAGTNMPRTNANLVAPMVKLVKTIGTTSETALLDYYYINKVMTVAR